MTRINYEIPDDLHDRIRMEATVQDKSNKQVIIDALDETIPRYQELQKETKEQ